MAVDKSLIALPESVTENDTLQIQFLAELSGVSTELADLITRDLPFLSVSVASFDSGPLAPDAPLTSAGLLSNVLRGTGLAPTSVQIAESPDQRNFVLTDATTESEFISTDDIASLLFRHGAYESDGGPLRIAVTIWKQILESQLESTRVGWRIPENDVDVWAQEILDGLSSRVA